MNTIAELTLREPTPLRVDDTIEAAVQALLDSELPALPVIDLQQRYAGIFGELEFFRALFPGYLDQLHGAAFLRRSLEETLERRLDCRVELVGEHLDREHVDVRPDHADTQLAEIFLHHKALVVPVVDHGQLRGVITRADFFRAVAERFLDR